MSGHFSTLCMKGLKQWKIILKVKLCILSYWKKTFKICLVLQFRNIHKDQSTVMTRYVLRNKFSKTFYKVHRKKPVMEYLF